MRIATIVASRRMAFKTYVRIAVAENRFELRPVGRVTSDTQNLSLAMTGWVIGGLNCRSMTRIAQLIVTSDQERPMIGRMRIVAIRTFQLNRAHRMMADLQEILLDLRMTRVADIRLIRQQ